MTTLTRRLLLGLSGLAAGVALPAGAAPPAPPAPKLIVALSIDQFAGDLYRQYRSSFSGGLARLGGGVAFTGYQSHAATETCPGHSTILSGRHPGRDRDRRQQLVRREDGIDASIASPPPGTVRSQRPRPAESCMSTTLWRLGQGGGVRRNRSFAVSGKDRAAITMARAACRRRLLVGRWTVGFTTSPFAGPATLAITRACTTPSTRRSLRQAGAAARPHALGTNPRRPARRLEKPETLRQDRAVWPRTARRGDDVREPRPIRTFAATHRLPGAIYAPRRLFDQRCRSPSPSG